MAVPAIIAFKERDNLLQLAMYAFLAIAVLYTLYKLFGMFKEVGEKVEEVKEKAKDIVSEAKNEVEYRVKHPAEAPARMAKAIVNPETPVEKFQRYAFNLLLPAAQVGEKIGKKLATDEKAREQAKTGIISGIVPAYGVYKAIKKLIDRNKPQPVKPRYITQEEYKDIQAKRWEAIAKFYEKQKKLNPYPIRRPLPIRTPSIHAL